MKKNNFFYNKKVIVTGNTGFKGSWLIIWLNLLGANVVGISIGTSEKNSMYKSVSKFLKIKNINLNIQNYNKLEKKILSFKPDIIFHLAAQSLVKYSYKESLETWKTNTLGTIHMLEVLKKIKNKCTVLFITSDKAYKNIEKNTGYKETDVLGGDDNYSASKASAEIAINSYYLSFFKNSKYLNIGTARAGNVIGGGDWSKDRIVPDCIKAWSFGNKVEIRNPNSIRPWQHVLEPLSGYLLLVMHLSKRKKNNQFNVESFNFGPNANKVYNVRKIVEYMAKNFENSSFIIKKEKNNNETKTLKLNISKSKKILGWRPVLNVKNTLKFTTDWYLNYYKNEDSQRNIYIFTVNQIKNYITIAKRKKLNWINF
jgi:CDP-glucose 4,6-dehydratase